VESLNDNPMKGYNKDKDKREANLLWEVKMKTPRKYNTLTRAREKTLCCGKLKLKRTTP
jgi:hypothetical protein